MTLPAPRPWLVLALIFIAGALTGSFLTLGLAPHFKRAPGAQQLKLHLLQQLNYRLHLTPDQQQKIEPIVSDAVTEIETRHHDEMASISQIIEHANQKIMPLLTADQKTEMQRLESEREEMFSGRGHHRAFHDGPEGRHGDGDMPNSPGSPQPPAPGGSPPGPAEKAEH